MKERLSPETLLAALWERSPFAMLALDASARVTAWNAAARVLFGLSEVDQGPVWLADVMRLAPDGPGLDEVLGKVEAEGRWHGQVSLEGPERPSARVDLDLWRFDLPEGGGSGVLAAARDVTERRRSEVVLRESEELYRSLVQAFPDGIALSDLQGRLVAANERAAEMRGAADVPELLASAETAFDLIAEDDRERAAAAMATTLAHGVVRGLEYMLIRKDGTTYPVELSAAMVRDGEGRPKGFIAVIRDITARKLADDERARLEAQVRQQQKLDSIGTLAAGVAHEINNPINVVMNYAELIRRRPDVDETIEGYAQEIVAESHRIAEIVRGLLAFAGKERERHADVRPADVVTATLALVRKVLTRDQILVHVDVPEDLPVLRCRRQQIQQVLTNLLTNARDALNARFPAHHPQKVVLVTGARLDDAEGRQWVRLTVEDHGVGIGPDELVRIFDPFFTSKPRGEGTGLGLSVSHGIVAEHGGRLHAESVPGSHTKVHVDLPASR